MYLEAVLDFVKTHGFKLLRVIEKKTFAWSNIKNLTTKRLKESGKAQSFGSNEAMCDPMKACSKHRKGRVKKKKN